MSEEHRRFYRHPTEIPIEVWETQENDLHRQHLHNVSLGGLAFESKTSWEKGSLISMRVLIKPPCYLFGRVVWCRATASQHFEVGIEFLEKNQKINEGMVDEVCEIERYRKMLVEIAEEISETSGYLLDDIA